MNIEFVVEEANKERRRLLGKGVSEPVHGMVESASYCCSQVKESTLPTLSEDIRKRLLKHFAGQLTTNHLLKNSISRDHVFIDFIESDIELKKQKSQQNLHAHNSRERMMEDTEKEKVQRIEVTCELILIITMN